LHSTFDIPKPIKDDMTTLYASGVISQKKKHRLWFVSGGNLLQEASSRNTHKAGIQIKINGFLYFESPYQKCDLENNRKSIPALALLEINSRPG
jgi:hypothetical protein